MNACLSFSDLIVIGADAVPLFIPALQSNLKFVLYVPSLKSHVSPAFAIPAVEILEIAQGEALEQVVPEPVGEI